MFSFFFFTTTNDVLVNILVYMSLCTCVSVSIWQILKSIFFSRSFQALCGLLSAKNRARRWQRCLLCLLPQLHNQCSAFFTIFVVSEAQDIGAPFSPDLLSWSLLFPEAFNSGLLPSFSFLLLSRFSVTLTPSHNPVSSPILICSSIPHSHQHP